MPVNFQRRGRENQNKAEPVNSGAITKIGLCRIF